MLPKPKYIFAAFGLLALSGCSLQSSSHVREYTMHYKDNDIFCAAIKETSTGGKKFTIGNASFSSGDTRQVITPTQCTSASLPFDPNVLM